MKATIFFVSEDPESIARAKSIYEADSNYSLKIFTVGQWDQVLEDEVNRQSMHLGVPTLAGGLGHEMAAKVLHFTKPTMVGGVETMEQLEAKAIESAILQFKGNLTEAAKALGIGRATLYRKVKHFSIDPNLARKRKAA